MAPPLPERSSVASAESSASGGTTSSAPRKTSASSEASVSARSSRPSAAAEASGSGGKPKAGAPKATAKVSPEPSVVAGRRDSVPKKVSVVESVPEGGEGDGAKTPPRKPPVPDEARGVVKPPAPPKPAPLARRPSLFNLEPVYLHLPDTLLGMVTSSWLVPSVRNRYAGQGLILMCFFLQFTLIASLAVGTDVFDIGDGRTTCGTPALVQTVAIMIFYTALIEPLVGTVSCLQVALFCKSIDEPDGEARPARELNRRSRLYLAIFPTVDLIHLIFLTITGSWFLMITEDTTELILNTVAVNFIAELDDPMLKAYANTASKQRLAKYRMQHRWGVPEGDTRLAHTDRQSIRMVRLLQRLHLFVFFGAAAAVAVGQVLGTARSGERFAFSRTYGSADDSAVASYVFAAEGACSLI